MINLHEPRISKEEKKLVNECLNSSWVSSSGKFINIFERKICDFTGSKYSIACINGTSALQLSLKIIGVKENDEVIVPTISFIAPINAVKYNLAEPIFMDSDEYFNIDTKKTIDFIKQNTFFKNGYSYNKKTKKRISAIIVVHVFGNAVDLFDLVKLCKSRNIIIVEDAAESLGTFYNSGNLKKRHTGTIGKVGCLSFNGNKIITSGGGGMILTNNKKLFKKAQYLSTQAKDDSKKYIHNDIGYNFRMSNVQAAIGIGQLNKIKSFVKNKKIINRCYINEIKKISGLEIYKTPSYSDNNFWLNILKIDFKNLSIKKDKLIEKLKKAGIETRYVWCANHIQKKYKKNQKYNIKKSYKLINNSLCLPSSSFLSKNDIKYIIDSLKKIINV